MAQKISHRRVPRPFLKWVGGKTQLLPKLLERMPAKFGVYHEPFVGGGALFLEVQPGEAHLSDTNAELMNCYQVLRRDLPRLIELLKQYPYEKRFYYRMRAKSPEDLEPVERAARTIYLNKTGFNGLYRVNSKGGFNVPFGRYTNPIICDETNLRAVAARLRGVKLHLEDFAKVLDRAKKGDFVYFDPPYYPLSVTAHFTDYTKDGFGHAEQVRLAETFDALHERGVFVMLSNSDHPCIHELYDGKGYVMEKVLVPRSVNSKPSARGKITEVLIRNYKKIRGERG